MDINNMTEVIVRPLQEDLTYPEYTARMPAGSKVIDLKKDIHKRWNLHPNQQILTHNNQPADDRRLLSEFIFTSVNPVFVKLRQASIRLSVVGLGNKREIVNGNLTSKISELKTAAFGDAKCRAREQVKLVFKGRELEWGDRLQTVQGLEDGSELQASPLRHITLTIATTGGEVVIPDVDLNLTIQDFKERHINKNRDPCAVRAAAELKKPGMKLCFEIALNWTDPLRTVLNLDEVTPLTLIVVNVGGH